MSTTTVAETPYPRQPSGAEGLTGSGELTPAAWAGLAGLLLLHAALAWLIREPGVTARNDDAIYLLLSRSLRGFHYLDSHLLGAPPHALYPPGYPAVLAVVTALAGERFSLLLGFNILCSTVSLGLLFDLVRRRWSVGLAFAVTAPLALNWMLLQYAGSLISEPLYLLCSVGALWFLGREAATTRTLGWGILLVMAAGLTRTAGAALTAALVAWLFLERRPRLAVVAAGLTAATIGAWLAWVFLLPDEFRTIGRSYAEDVERMVFRGGDYYLYKRWKISLLYTREFLPDVVALPGVQGRAGLAVWGWTLVAAAVAGLVLLWRRWRLAALYLVAYAGVLVSWRMSSPRFLAVILPLVLVAVMLPVGEWLNRRKPGLGLGAAAALALLLSLGGLGRWREDWRAISGCDRSAPLEQAGCYPDDHRSFFRLARRMGELTGPDAVAVTAREASFAYYSGRRTAYLNASFPADSSSYVTALRQRGVGFVVLGHTNGGEPQNLAPRLSGECRWLDVIAEEPPRTYLFQLRSTPWPDSLTPACRALAGYLADTTAVPRLRK